jgi:hypothetical protein
MDGLLYLLAILRYIDTMFDVKKHLAHKTKALDYRVKAIEYLLPAVGLLLAGGIVSYISYSLAKPGAIYMVASGALLIGMFYLVVFITYFLLWIIYAIASSLTNR